MRKTGLSKWVANVANHLSPEPLCLEKCLTGTFHSESVCTSYLQIKSGQAVKVCAVYSYFVSICLYFPSVFSISFVLSLPQHTQLAEGHLFPLS